MAFLSFWIAVWTRPLDAFCDALGVTFSDGPMKMLRNASCVPEACVRTLRLIGPVTFAPGTSSQRRTLPEKMSWTFCWDRFAIALSGLVATHTPSRAILLNVSPPGSPDCWSREDMPMFTRLRATSPMPTSEPPWETVNFVFGYFFLYALMRSTVRG